MFRVRTMPGGRQRGYTLGELLTAMAVLGILSAAAIPAFQDTVQNNRRVSVSNSFVHTMRLARSEAIARNQRVTVCASRNGTACTSRDYWGEGWIAFNDIDLNRSPGGDGESILHVVKMDGNVDILPSTFANSYTYRPNGRVMGNTVDKQSGEFVFCDKRGNDYARVVVVGINGRPELSEKTSKGLTPNCG